MNKNTKIVTIGGGSGQYVLLSGLRDLENIDIVSVVSMVDSGGSTGRLRDEMGVLPPGDVLKCTLALSPDRGEARKILLTRFESDNRLKGHNAGNMLLSVLSQYAGSFPAGINALGEILHIKGRVLPVTIDRATLVAELTNGDHLYGESTIDVPRGGQREKIKRTFLVPHHSECIKVYPPVIDEINEADYIVIGPGDLFTSIIPNLIVPGVAEAVQKTKAKIIYAVNIMTKYGETDGFSVKDFITEIERKIARKIDFALVNNKEVSQEIMEGYKKQKADMVRLEADEDWAGRKIIAANLLSLKGGIVRHDKAKLAKAIEKIIN